MRSKNTTLEFKSPDGFHSIAIGSISDWIGENSDFAAEVEIDDFVELLDPDKSIGNISITEGSSFFDEDRIRFVPKEVVYDRFLLINGLGGRHYSKVVFSGNADDSDENFLLGLNASYATILIFGENGDLTGNGRALFYLPTK